MVEALALYVDDSGTRMPDYNPAAAAGTANWFGLGGVLLRERDEPNIRQAHAAFYKRWPQLRGPLHSNEIRFDQGPFAFLGKDETLRIRFLEDLTELLNGAEVLGHACVIDRPGYMARYANQYGDERWFLCKTAFSILLERAAKHALRCHAKLRVYVERTDKDTDTRMRGYYENLRSNGMPFKVESSTHYVPMTADTLRAVLYDLKFKNESSPLMQFADLYLWPICKAAYGKERAYKTFKKRKRLLDSVLEPSERDERGIKYSCFDQAPPHCVAAFQRALPRTGGNS
jgi:hypothetical protein